MFRNSHNHLSHYRTTLLLQQLNKSLRLGDPYANSSTIYLNPCMDSNSQNIRNPYSSWASNMSLIFVPQVWAAFLSSLTLLHHQHCPLMRGSQTYMQHGTGTKLICHATLATILLENYARLKENWRE